LYLSATHGIGILVYSSATLISDPLNILLHISVKYIHPVSGVNAKSLIIAILPIFLVSHVFLKFFNALLISERRGLSFICIFITTPSILMSSYEVLCISPIVYCMLLNSSLLTYSSTTSDSITFVDRK
jgi:hypothetical protein